MGKVLQLFPEFEENSPQNLPGDSRNLCEVVVGDASHVLVGFPDGLFQTVVTSPPYWGLRDYGVKGQIGAEMAVEDYIANLVSIFREVRRTLANDGTLWLNIGDSYTSGGRTWRDDDAKNKGRGMSYRAPTPNGLKPKDLIGVPWRVAFALQADGWYLRSDMVWNKPNCQPESVKDRPTRSHEYIFLFSKSERYFYDHEAIQETALNRSQGTKEPPQRVEYQYRALRGSAFCSLSPFSCASLCGRRIEKRRQGT
jgi:site-specific DNA-methyltransferase (cytosine-N4-specific)